VSAYGGGSRRNAAGRRNGCGVALALAGARRLRQRRAALHGAAGDQWRRGESEERRKRRNLARRLAAVFTAGAGRNESEKSEKRGEKAKRKLSVIGVKIGEMAKRGGEIVKNYRRGKTSEKAAARRKSAGISMKSWQSAGGIMAANENLAAKPEIIGSVSACGAKGENQIENTAAKISMKRHLANRYHKLKACIGVAKAAAAVINGENMKPAIKS